MRYILSFLTAACICLCINATVKLTPPAHLTIDLLEHSDMVLQDGLPSSMSLNDVGNAIERFQIPFIKTSRPTFGWVMQSESPDSRQTSYRILVATSKDKLLQEQADIWDSGVINDGNSSSVGYTGKSLSPRTLYYWTVQIRDNHGMESGFAIPKGFMTAPVLDDAVSTYPLEASIDSPTSMRTIQNSINIVEYINAEFNNLPGERFLMQMEIPANSIADVRVPAVGGKSNLMVDGKKQKYKVKDGFISLSLSSGHHTVEVISVTGQ